MLLAQSPALFIAWLFWCLLHSLLASNIFKKSISPIVPQKSYRITYVIFSTISLAALIFWQYNTIGQPAPAGPAWQLPRLLFAGYGIFMLWAGSRAYDIGEFLGLKADRAYSSGTATVFRRDGILGHVRHPWYSGGIALVMALGETPLDRWDWRMLLAVYLVVGCLIEERRLAAELEETYRKYQKEVPMLLPRIKSGEIK